MKEYLLDLFAVRYLFDVLDYNAVILAATWTFLVVVMVASATNFERERK